MTRTAIAVGAAAVAVALAIAIPALAGQNQSPPLPQGFNPGGPMIPGGSAVGVARVLPTYSPPTGAGPANTVTVTGSATITSQPDEAVIDLGVQTQASTAQAALQQNANKMQAVLDALGKLGIKGNDVSTASVSLYPNYSPTGNSVSGYQASDEISATIHDLSNVGKAIDDSVAAGANVSNGITFQLSNQNKGVTSALASAVANAQTKAESLAQAAGASLGPVVSIQEGTSNPGPIPFEGMTAQVASGSASPTPVQPGTIQTQVTVTVVWSIG
jgi:uncharacterized protein